MRNEQEMQFADPDWKPTGQLSGRAGDIVAPASPSAAAEAGSVNNQVFGTYQAGSLPDYEQGYHGPPPESSLPVQQIPAQPFAQQMPYASMTPTRRRSHWWIWLIIGVIFISMMSGGGLFKNYSGYNNPSYLQSGQMEPGHMKPMQGQHIYNYDLQNATQVNIADPSGSITVQVANGGSQGVEISTNNGSSAQPQVNYQGQDMLISSSNAGDITVIVPQNVALNLQTGENTIEVDGFAGQLTAQTDGGLIRLAGDTLSPQSTLTTNSGNIDMEQGAMSGTAIIWTNGEITLNQVDLSGKVTMQTGGQGNISFSGTLDPQGNYQFTTDSGYINLTVPQGTAMQTKITQKSGSYHSDFAPNAGSSPQASVGITTNSGNIGIYQQ